MSESPKSSRSLAGIAGIVAIATLISKVFGLVRQVTIAAAFGTKAAYGAYQYSSIIPGFFLILLGGINGPFHSALVSALAKRDKAESAPLVETVSTLVGGVLIVVTLVLMALAPQCIDLIAPGLHQTAHGLEIREIAIQQLRIMAPIAWFAGMIGIGFGTLNAADLYWLPSVSPLLSSVTIIAGVGALALTLGPKIGEPEYAALGGIVLAWAALIGTILQWLVQVWAQHKAGLSRLRLGFDFKHPGVKDVMNVMAPALFASGMLQINVYTDMFFTSFLPNPGAAVSALDYANLLVQTPLGILSNVILVPFLPVFSRLADPTDWAELKMRIRQGLLLTAISMLPMSALIVTLANPIVRIVYERGAFQQSDSDLVAVVLMAYAIGMFVYLGRDVLVRVFYALGDGETPFRISIVSIFLNALFDFILIKPLGLPGLVLATVSVNVISIIALLWFLDRKLNGLPLKEWALPFVGLAIASVFAGLASWGTLRASEHFLGTNGFLILIGQLGLSALAGLSVFALIASRLKLPEVDIFVSRIRQRFVK